MKRWQSLIMLMATVVVTACANDKVVTGIIAPPHYLPVRLSVQSDQQGQLREFPVAQNTSHYRAYIEASPNDRYRLRVVNNSNQRVGLVIAVDGRNIISGKQSWLANTERMYILNPHESADYEGWRTSANQTNRFYFTQMADSYAAAWGDTSAMGVIAMAVYAERSQPRIAEEAESSGGLFGQADAKAPASAAAPPGTGFGESHYSPSTSVSFQPNAEAMEKVFLKYEWRETLCRKGIKRDCAESPSYPPNRLWQDNGFAPPPPR